MSITSRLMPTELRGIYEKVVAGGRITDAEGLELYRSRDLNALGAIANVVRERKNGNVATYIHNQYINYSNVCVLSCQFCAFGARKRDAHAFELSIDEIVERVRVALGRGITEIHMVGGLHPTLKAEWYLDLLQRLRALDPDLFIKAFTAVEMRHLADRVFKLPMRELMIQLREAGLGALTGGGAEIFDQEVRDQICRGKETAEEWAEVHRTWHQLGMRSTATMLFGHIETLEQRVDHLRRLRALQDETGGFTGFVPFACVPETTALAHIKPATAFEELCNLAVSRIYLDNFDHVTAYWVSLGLPLAALALNYGVDDLHGTIMEEKIFHMAGATTPTQQAAESLERAIREAGREPMQRDTWYRRIAPHLADSRRSGRSRARAGACGPRLRVTPYPALANLRIGCVRYLNSRPLIHDYPGPVWFAHPSELARGMETRVLDAGLVSIYWAFGPQPCSIVDGVAIASDGPVYSVVLAYRGELEKVETVRLDPASLTSVHLLQVLLAEFHGRKPRCLPEDPHDTESARLLIGSQAITFRGQAGPDWRFLDLGEEWQRCTGLPFVYAAWMLQPELADQEKVAGEFRQLKAAGLRRLEEIVAAEKSDFARTYLTQHIRFELGERERLGLQRFQELAHRQGLIEAPRLLRFV